MASTFPWFLLTFCMIVWIFQFFYSGGEFIDDNFAAIDSPDNFLDSIVWAGEVFVALIKTAWTLVTFGATDLPVILRGLLTAFCTFAWVWIIFETFGSQIAQLISGLLP